MARKKKGWSGRKTLLVLAAVFGLPLLVLWGLGMAEMIQALGVFLLVGVGGCAVLLLMAVRIRDRIGVDWGEFWRGFRWRR